MQKLLNNQFEEPWLNMLQQLNI